MKTEDYIKVCSEVHNGFYNYDKTEYHGLCNKVTITCPVHGDFKQEARLHLSGRVCIKCAAKSRSEKRVNQSRLVFAERCSMVHNSKYDYSKVEYINSRTKVCIICPEHGDFWQTPSNHLAGHGCNKCAAVENGRRVYNQHRNKRGELNVGQIPDGAGVIPLGAHGDYFIADSSDCELLSKHNWYKNAGGYVANNKVGLVHRFLLGLSDPSLQVDHSNHNKLDNRRSNLRVCSHSENNKNRPKGKGSNTYKGVTWNIENKRWVVHICSNGNQMHIGTFLDEIEAAKAYDEAAKKYHGEFACLNFPNE